MKDRFIKHIITSQLIIYIFRCILGFLSGYFLMLKFPQYELFWGLLSIILVISPEGKDSRRLTIERVKSNFIGSGVGLFCHLIHSEKILILILGIIITSIVCYLFNVMNMSRVAIVAFLVVMLQATNHSSIETPIIRFSTVVIGCIIGLSITVVTSIIIRYYKRQYNIPY